MIGNVPPLDIVPAQSIQSKTVGINARRFPRQSASPIDTSGMSICRLVNCSYKNQSRRRYWPVGLSSTSLRQQIEVLEDRLLNFLLLSMGLCGITAAFMPVLMQSLVSAIPAKYKILSVGISLAAAVPAILTSLVVARTVVARTNLRLGLSGEQATAEALHEISDAGFRVFHDFKPSEDWNIDHVIAGSKGVFVIETKTRSRRGPANGLEAHKVRVDGPIMMFPFGRDDEATAQAKRNAAWLSDFLSKRTGESVPVEPIVALPGWYVIDPEEGPVPAMGCNYLKGYLRRQDKKSRRRRSRESLPRWTREIGRSTLFKPIFHGRGFRRLLGGTVAPMITIAIAAPVINLAGVRTKLLECTRQIRPDRRCKFHRLVRNVRNRCRFGRLCSLPPGASFRG